MVSNLCFAYFSYTRAVSTEIDNSVNRRNSQRTFDPAHIFLVCRPVGLLLQPVEWPFFTFIEINYKDRIGHPTYFGIGIDLIGWSPKE